VNACLKATRAGRLEITGVEKGFAFVPSRLRLLHLFGRRRGLRIRAQGEEDEGEDEPRILRERHESSGSF
jgi:hypothetical protein